MKSTIVQAMARAFFVSAYADYCDNHPELKNLPRAGAGEDWMDVTEEIDTPLICHFEAYELLGRLVEKNGRAIYTLIADAERADLAEGKSADRDSEKYQKDFGHYIAMSAMGHGVCWFDDHAKFELSVPHQEFSFCDLEDWASEHFEEKHAFKAMSTTSSGIGNSDSETLAEEHMRRVHCDGSKCEDGCNKGPVTGEWRCSACGCPHVEYQAWVTMNGDRVQGDAASDGCWCPNCEDHLLACMVNLETNMIDEFYSSLNGKELKYPEGGCTHDGT